MIYSDPLRFLFIMLCLILINVLIFLTVLMYKKKNEYRYSIGCSIILGILAIIFYIVFLNFRFSESHKGALFFCGLFYISTDFLALSMLIFGMNYTDMLKRQKEKIITICSNLCWLDTFSLFLNNIYNHMFDVVYMTNNFEKNYWGVIFTPFHYIHLFFCYIMVGITFALLIIKTITCARLYKEKFHGVLIAYIIVILTNMFCYSMNTTFDFSVILYAVLAGFICYYATYSFPYKLLNQSLQNVNETISDGLLYYDLNGRCIYANRIAKLIFTNEKGYGRKKAENYKAQLLEKLAENSADEKIIEVFEVEGETRQYEIDYQKEFFQNIEIGCYIRLIDKTFLIETYEKERNAATHDVLTGLLNRQGFFDAVDNYVLKNGIENRIMVCSDIKDFKLINELFGEKTGDEVLIKQAQLLTKNSHDSTIYGRLGDDKFGLFVDKKYLSQEYLQHCINLIKTMTDSTVYQMCIHAGIYETIEPSDTAQTMCDKALMAIETIEDDYQAVFARYDSSLMDKIIKEKKFANDFPEAFEKNQIKMYLQPIINAENATFGAEALCRWEHPDLGLLLPKSFIPVLEKSGYIYQLDEYIWNQAAKKLHEWTENGITNCFISVNISEKDFYYTDVYKTFNYLIDKYDINPECLHIEITETALMSDFNKALQLAIKLRSIGFKVSIDNFGNGYSSLNMLKDFTADTLKIDMTFLNDEFGEERNEVILESIITMAKNLDMDVIGEGVEKKYQYDLLRQYGCTIFQGYYLSEPLAESEFESRYTKFS